MKEVYAGRSSIHGRGLYIREDAKKDERICFIKGNRIVKRNNGKVDALANPDWVGISKYVWINPVPPFKYINHSCDPNTGIKGAVTLYALRDLKPDEELTIDYSTIEGDPLWEMEGGLRCLCGAKNCRKIVRSIQFLPKSTFQRYVPYISTYFKKLYQRS